MSKAEPANAEISEAVGLAPPQPIESAVPPLNGGNLRGAKRITELWIWGKAQREAWPRKPCLFIARDVPANLHLSLTEPEIAELQAFYEWHFPPNLEVP